LESKPPIPYKRVVLLGHTGFLGKALYRVFQGHGADVRGLGSADLDLRRFERLAVLDDQLDADTALIVTSALTPDKGATLEVLQDNIQMYLNLGRYLETRPVGLCVYISSDAVYPFLGNPVTEESPVEPASIYALGKYSGERILARQAEVKGLQLLNLRLTALYGPGDTHGSYGPNSFMRSLVKDKTVRLFGQGEEQRDHLHVDDAARLICLLVCAKTTGTYNLATGTSHSFADVVNVLRRVVPAPFEVVSAPRKAPVTHRHFDVTKLFLQVPDFQYTSIEEGLATYYRSSVQA